MHLHAGELAGARVGEVERIGGDEVERLIVALEPDRRVEPPERHRPAVRVLRSPAYKQIVDLGGRLPVLERRGELREQVRVPHGLEQTQADLPGRERVAARDAVVARAPHGEARDRDGPRLLERHFALLRRGADGKTAEQGAIQRTAHLILRVVECLRGQLRRVRSEEGRPVGKTGKREAGRGMETTLPRAAPRSRTRPGAASGPPVKRRDRRRPSFRRRSTRPPPPPRSVPGVGVMHRVMAAGEQRLHGHAPGPRREPASGEPDQGESRGASHALKCRRASASGATLREPPPPSPPRRAYGVAVSARSASTSPAPVAFAPQLTVLVVTPSVLVNVAVPGGSGSALVLRMVSASPAVSAGCFSAISATMPATWGLAMEVPLKKK